MKTVFSLLATFLLTAFFLVFPAEACWAGFSTAELVEQSDLIVIGAIKGISKTEKKEGAWQTYWEVDIEYFLKGDAASSLLIVATPGAKNKQPIVSTHYDLNAWGDTVLLFLTKKEAYFAPLSPQGVVALGSVGSSRQDETTSNLGDFPPQNQLNGEHLLKKYNIVDEKMPGEDKKELENYISKLPKILAATPEIEDKDSGSKNQTKTPSSLGIIGGADGPTSIHITGNTGNTGNPLKALQVPAIIFAVIIFAGGFGLGYFIKTRRK